MAHHAIYLLAHWRACAAARAIELQIHLLRASTEHEIEAAFATLLEVRAGG
jgi:hypothetical protein